MLRLLLARHGVTTYNVEARIQGQQNIPLSPSGEQQAAALGIVLATVPLDAIYSSDLQRARQTAEAVARHQPCPVILWPALREIALGLFEGHTSAELVEEYPQELAAWRSDPVGTAPPGGETRRQLFQRAIAAYERVLAQHAHGSILWVTHGGIISMVLDYVLGIDIRHPGFFRRDNCAITELAAQPGHVEVIRVNDTCHLRSLTDIEQEEAQVL